MFKNTIKKVGFALAIVCLFFASICVSGCGDPTYKIQFMIDGKVYHSVTTAGRQNIRMPSEPQKNGYDFDGWYFDEGDYLIEFTSSTYSNTTPSSDVRIYAKWNLNEYTLMYDNVPGDVTNDNPFLYTVEDETFTLHAPSEREGYEFLGWECDGNIITQIPKGSYGDKVLTARWQATRYGISYQGLMDGINSNENPTYYTIEDSVTFKDATRVGYRFAGWSDGINIVQEVRAGSIGELILVAQWEVETYQIEYLVEDGTNPDVNPVTYTIIDGDIVFSEPTRENYKFVGWFDEDGNKIEKIDAGSTGNRTITAGWAPIYTLTLNYNYDGAGSRVINFSADDEDIVLGTPERVGYTFIGWYDYDKKYDIFDSSIEANIELTALWEINKYNLAFVVGDKIQSIFYSLDGGETYLEINSNTVIKIEYNNMWFAYAVAKAGYLSNNTLENPYISTILEEDSEYIPTTTPITYTMTLSIDDNGSELTYPTEYNIEDELEAPEVISSDSGNIDFTKEGYTLYWQVTAASGNWEENEKFLAGTKASKMYGNVVLTATYETIEYTISYDLNDNEDATTIRPDNATVYTIEDTIVLEEATRTGYDFLGWWTGKDETDTRVNSILEGTTGAITLVARWAPKSYDLVLTIAENSNIASIYYRVNGATTYTQITETTEVPVDFGTTWYAYAVAENGYSTRYNANYNYISGTMTTNGASFAPTGELVTYTITLVASGFSNQTMTYTITTGFTLPSAIYVDGGNSINYLQDRAGYDLHWTASTVAGNWEIGDIVEYGVATEIGEHYGNVTFTATYTAIKYTITYELNGGTNSILNPGFYTVAMERQELIAPVKEGYRFVKWTLTNESGETITAVGGSTERTTPITLFANWEEAYYNLTLTINDKIASIYYKIGDDVDFTQVTETTTINNLRHGTTWQAYAVVSSEYTSTYETTYDENNIFSGTIATGGSTFSPQAKTYTIYSISYETNGGTNSQNNPSEYTKLMSITFEGATKEGYTFEGWIDQNGNTIEGISTGTTGALSLTAQWGVSVSTQAEFDEALSDVTIRVINLLADMALNSSTSISRDLTINLGSHTIDTTNGTIEIVEDLTVSLDKKCNELFTYNSEDILFIEKVDVDEKHFYAYSIKTLEYAQTIQGENNVLFKEKIGDNYFYSQTVFNDVYADVKDGDEIILLSNVIVDSMATTTLAYGTVKITIDVSKVFFGEAMIKINAGMSILLNASDHENLFTCDSGSIQASQNETNGYYTYFVQ